MRKLIFALAFGALLLPDYGFTLGLGEIEVNSALNQELNAEIELLSAAPEDAEKLIVKLASREEFSRAGLDRPFMLSDLQFSTVMKNGQPWISVRTSKPVREPFLNFLLEIDWPKGHLLREYTILLDPPAFMEKAPDDTYRPAMSEAASAAQAPVQSSDTAETFRPAAGAATARKPATAAPTGQARTGTGTQTRYQPGNYRIQNGDTAWSLAESMRPDQSVSVEQMMLAMLRSNPEAFIDENVNGLKRGYILRLPDPDEITSMSQAESLALVRQQNALWREYQQSLAKGKPASAMDTGTAAGAGAGSEQAPGARLAIVAAGSGTAASGMKEPSQMNESELRAELARAREALESGLVEKEELQARVESLEGQVDRMKSLLTLEDADMASMQMQAQEAPSAQAPMGEDAEQTTEQAQATEDTGLMVEETVTETGMPEESSTAEGTGEVVTEEQVFVDEQAPVEGAETEDMTQPADQAAPYTATEMPPQQKQKGLLSSLLGNPVLLAGVGGGLLLVIVLIVLIIKRRGASAEPEMAASLAAVTDIEQVADMVADEDVDTKVSDEEVEEHMAAMMAEAEAEENVEETLAAEESFDADSTLVLPGMEDTVVTQPPEQVAETEDEGDDVTAEADVYLAYGIYQQAEELLKNAIRENPDRDAYRVKLAETYYASKNADAFAEMATEMHERIAGAETPAWKKVAAIGKELCPDHELFKDAEMASDLNMDDLVPKSPEPMDIDLGAAQDDALLPDLDIGLDLAEEPEAADLEQTAALDLTSAEPEEELEEEGVEFDLTETEAIEPEDDEEFSLDIEASELDIQDEETPESATIEDTGVDFNLDIGTETEPQAVAEEAAEEVTPQDDTAAPETDVGEIDFDISAEEETHEAEQAELDEAESAGDESGLDFDLDASEEIAIESEAVDAVEEAGLDLDLGADEEDVVGTAAIDNELDEDIDLSMLDDVDEVSTKLDLARAYLDMGDAEGTRSILDEVIAEGNDEQKQEAEELLKQLDS